MSAPLNAARGEVALECRGREIRLCVTLGALAELEAAFGVAGLGALGQRLHAASMADLVVVLSALAHEHGKRFTTAQIAVLPISPSVAAQAIARAFEQAFADV